MQYGNRPAPGRTTKQKKEDIIYAFVKPCRGLWSSGQKLDPGVPVDGSLLIKVQRPVETRDVPEIGAECSHAVEYISI